MSSWRHDMTESSYAFKTYVWPKVGPWCGEGRLEIVESSTANGLLRDFDTLAGIDAWQLLDDRGFMRGLASRVQVGAAQWRTFTVRKSRSSGAKTEFAKRLEAIEKRREGALYPVLTIHAYVQDYRHGPLLSVAMVYTADLYEYLKLQISEGRAKTRKTSNAEFYWVPWEELAASRVQIRMWPLKQRRIASRIERREAGNQEGITQYRGYNFLTAVEARWAVFFDTLDRSWDYDPKAEWGLFNAQHYRPQFLLPSLNAYLEVQRPDDDQNRRPLQHYDPEIQEPVVYLAVGDLPDERQLSTTGWWDPKRHSGVMSLTPGFDWNKLFPPDYPDVLRAIEVARAKEFELGIPFARPPDKEAKGMPERERERRQE